MLESPPARAGSPGPRRMLVNGSFDTRVAATDRGLLYGDGLFETLLVAGGAPCLWLRHLERLATGCERLKLAMPEPELLLAEVRSVIGEATVGAVKLILTRGVGGRGYRPDVDRSPTRIVQMFPLPEYPADWTEDGITARFCSTPLGINPALAGLKHLNRLEQVLARGEWRDPAIAEGVMLDTDGRVIEGTMSNLFVIRNKRLLTPRLDGCGVAGVMRGLTIDSARTLDITTDLTDLYPPDLRSADAAFFTNSLFGIWPIKRLDEVAYDPRCIPETLRRRVQERMLDSELGNSGCIRDERPKA